MRRRPGEPLPATVQPCMEFAMSDRFRDWAVGQMRKDVGGQVSLSGLDRMAILKRPSGEPPDQEK